MGLPLYRLEELKRERENLVRQARGNGGLIFNKYFNLWKIDPKIKAIGPLKQEKRQLGFR